MLESDQRSKLSKLYLWTPLSLNQTSILNTPASIPPNLNADKTGKPEAKATKTLTRSTQPKLNQVHNSYVLHTWFPQLSRRSVFILKKFSSLFILSTSGHSHPWKASHCSRTVRESKPKIEPAESGDMLMVQSNHNEPTADRRGMRLQNKSLLCATTISANLHVRHPTKQDVLLRSSNFQSCLPHLEHTSARMSLQIPSQTKSLPTQIGRWSTFHPRNVYFTTALLAKTTDLPRIRPELSAGDLYIRKGAPLVTHSQVHLATCKRHLVTCKRHLATCKRHLATCKQHLATCKQHPCNLYFRRNIKATKKKRI